MTPSVALQPVSEAAPTATVIGHRASSSLTDAVGSADAKQPTAAEVDGPGIDGILSEASDQSSPENRREKLVWEIARTWDQAGHSLWTDQHGACAQESEAPQMQTMDDKAARSPIQEAIGEDDPTTKRAFMSLGCIALGFNKVEPQRAFSCLNHCGCCAVASATGLSSTGITKTDRCAVFQPQLRCGVYNRLLCLTCGMDTKASWGLHIGTDSKPLRN
jgi:hypothetical protein